MEDVPNLVIEDCAQLVKANSIQGTYVYYKKIMLYYHTRWCLGNNQSVGSSVPVISQWL